MVCGLEEGKWHLWFSPYETVDLPSFMLQQAQCGAEASKQSRKCRAEECWQKKHSYVLWMLITKSLPSYRLFCDRFSAYVNLWNKLIHLVRLAMEGWFPEQHWHSANTFHCPGFFHIYTCVIGISIAEPHKGQLTPRHSEPRISMPDMQRQFGINKGLVKNRNWFSY